MSLYTRHYEARKNRPKSRIACAFSQERVLQKERKKPKREFHVDMKRILDSAGTLGIGYGGGDP